MFCFDVYISTIQKPSMIHPCLQNKVQASEFNIFALSLPGPRPRFFHIMTSVGLLHNKYSNQTTIQYNLHIPLLRLYSQCSLCLPYLPLHLFTYSINTVQHLPCVRSCAYQGIILPLPCLESSYWNPMTPTRLVHICHHLRGWLLGQRQPPGRCTVYLICGFYQCQMLVIHPSGSL